MLKELFSSKARIEVLKLFVLNPGQMFYQRGIASQSNLPIQAVQREVGRMLRIGFLKKSVSGNRVYYRVNKDCPIYPDLKSIILKTSGIADLLKQYLKSGRPDDIRLAFIYGSYAKNTENINSDIDLVIIGNISSRKMAGLLAPAKSQLKREINFVIYPEQEFRNNIARKNYFLANILKEPKIMLIGNNDDIKRIIKQR